MHPYQGFINLFNVALLSFYSMGLHNNRPDTATLLSSAVSVSPSLNLVFEDEFNGTSLDSSKWRVEEGDDPVVSWLYNDPGDVSVTNGFLKLTVEDKSINDLSYATGFVTTADRFSFLYGRVEIVALMPPGQGLWSGLWLLGERCMSHTPICPWPTPGSDEIDIVESKNGDPQHPFLTNHYGSVPGDDQYVSCGREDFSVSDTTTNWHTYAIDWYPGIITWYIDGVQLCQSTVGVPSHPMFLLMEATGGADGEITGLPSSMYIDSVKIWSPNVVNN